MKDEEESSNSAGMKWNKRLFGKNWILKTESKSSNLVDIYAN